MKKVILNSWLILMTGIYCAYFYQTYHDVIYRVEMEEHASLFRLQKYEIEKLENTTLASKIIYRVWM